MKKNQKKNLKKNLHLSYKDRCIIQEFLTYGYSFTAITNRIQKDNSSRCKQPKMLYDAAIADHEYHHNLSLLRADLKVTKDQVAAINDVVSPLMIHKHHSVNHVYVSHPEVPLLYRFSAFFQLSCPVSLDFTRSLRETSPVFPSGKLP